MFVCLPRPRRGRSLIDLSRKTRHFQEWVGALHYIENPQQSTKRQGQQICEVNTSQLDDVGADGGDGGVCVCVST